MAICLYSRDCTDFSTNGLGVLTPTACTAYGDDGHYSQLELTQPIDATFRWAQLQPGCLLKAPVPVRESPVYEEIEDITEGQTVTRTREIWRVRVNSRLRLRNGPSTSHRILDAYPNGTLVVKLGQNGVWFRVTVVRGGKTGWMRSDYLRHDHNETEVISQQKVIGHRAIQYTLHQDQLWRIYHVEPDTEKRVVKVKAQHVFYDLSHNLVDGEYEPSNVAADMALRAVWGKLHTTPEHALHVASGLNAKISGTYSWKNPVEVLLDPEDGILSQANGLLTVDGWDVFCLRNAVRDCGVTLRRGKNLKGVIVQHDDAGVVTRLLPVGKTKDGNPLYLTDGTGPKRQCVDSSHLNEYPHPRLKKLDCDVRIVDKDPDNEKTFTNVTAARNKLRALAQAEFSEKGADLASYGLKVTFALLQYAEEYEAYSGLQSVYLNDTVTVIDSLIGLTAKVRVTGFKYDCLKGQYDSVTLGDVDSTETTVYSYNLPTGGISGSKIAPNSADGGILRSMSLEYAKISQATVERLNADSITALTATINALTSSTITTDELYAAYGHLIQLAADSLEAGHIQTDTLAAALADIVVLRAQQVQASAIQTDALSAAIARIVALYADSLTAATLEADQLGAALARIVSLSARVAEFDLATIQNLVSSALTLESGYADSMLITNLAVTSANLLNATLGKLALMGTDGNYYDISVGADGTLHTALVELTPEEIAAGETSDGRKISTEAINAAAIDATTVRASEAVLNTVLTSALTAGQITANDAMLASATIPTLYTTSINALGNSLDLRANQSITLAVQDAVDDLDYVTHPEFERVVRVDSGGLHVGDNYSASEVLIDSSTVNVVINNTRYSKFGANYVQFGNYQMRLTADGGIVFKLEG